MGGDLLTSAECLNIIRENEMKHAAEEAIQSCYGESMQVICKGM